ncbi:MAG TPA: iron-containing redox enzyme family protein [Candidatus Obscuribacterales bacterium]
MRDSALPAIASDEPKEAVQSRNRSARSSQHLKDIARNHACFRHELFDKLTHTEPQRQQIARLLKNYDAHASYLRRLLLRSASIMPEKAVGFILENVRNEYGNGDAEKRHQLQLQDLARVSGVSALEFKNARIEPGIKRFISRAAQLYYPVHADFPAQMRRPAIAAGAITATEILAIEEFRCMQQFFAHLGLANHVWFDHIAIEVEHSEESLAIALYFCNEEDAAPSVEYGLRQMLDNNINLYDGLCEALSSNGSQFEMLA